MEDVLYIPCFCHILNLVVKDAINDDKNDNKIASVIKKCRKLVGCFKHSNKLIESLNKYFLANKKDKSSLKQDVVTRWNSTFLMIRSILNCYDAVRFVLNEPGNKEHRQLLLRDNEIELLEELVNVLQPFYDFTENLSGSKYVTCSIIIPTYYLIIQNMDLLKDSTTNNDINNVIDDLKASLTSRGSCYVQKIELLTATYLDPRFRNFKFISDNKTKGKLLDDVTRFIITQSKSLNIAKPSSRSQTETCRSSIVRRLKYVDLDDNHEQAFEISDEINNFSNFSVKVFDDSCPLEFFKNNSKQFPMLSEIAKKLFCITASSVPCEQLFSKAGEIISEKRNRLSPELAEFIVLLDQKY